MKKPDIPANEPERQAALRALEVLDTPPEERFDRITRIAQRHFGVPIALVSLVDAGRQWFKSRQGLAATETPRDISFCGHAILADGIFQIQNALKDLRFADNPLVTGGPEIRFYAGAPLHAPGGERVGTLCIIDGRPRQLSTEDLAMLRDLADAVEAELGHAQLRKTEMQMRSAQNRLRALINTVVDGIVTIDGRGVVHTFNPAAERLFGFAAAEVIGRNVSMLMPEPYHSAHDAYLHNYLSTGKRKIIGIGREVTGKRKDGSSFPMELAVSEMQVDGERMFTGIVRDIAERRATEAEVKALSLRLELALASAQLGIWDWDVERNVLVWDDRMYALYGVTREAFGGAYEAWLAGVHPEDRARCDEAVQAAIRGEKTYDIEFRVCWPDGAIHWIKANGKMLKGAAGQVVRAVGINFDITERKEAEIALSEQKHLLSESQRIAHIGGWSWDLKGTIHWTDEAYRIYGVLPETFTPTAESLVHVVHPEDRPAMQRWLAACAAGAKPGDLEFRTLLVDGAVRFLSGRGELKCDAENRPIGMSGTVQDITVRKQAEQELLAARDAAELANRAKDSFLATMSHEIRTPLGGLMGMLELLSLSPLNREQGETLQTARDSGRSLLRILNDILDWSKIEEGKLELAPQPTSVAQLVAGVANTYAHVASGNSVTLAQQVDARLAPAFVVDPLRLSQVLNNFVSNAIKFSHGGRVELRAELIERLGGAERVRFSVKDTGIGIEKEAQQHLFQIYGQGSADTARMYGGTGLGLAICRRLADLLGARIEVESAPGRGSTFSITLTLPVAEAAPARSGDLFANTISLTLPVAEAAKRGNRDLFATTIPLTLPIPETAAPTKVQSAGGAAAAAFVPPLAQGVAQTGAPLVLVVDDHPTNRKLLALQLRLLGLRTETAEDGEAGLALWRDGRYALVITDCHMPHMDGYALTRAIRRIETVHARARTPVFAWTANALADEIGNCRAAGMDELLVKPAELAQLKQVLSKWLLIAAEPVPGLGPALASPAAVAPAVDVSVLKGLVGDDEAVVREFLQDFRTSLGGIAAGLRAACAAGEAKTAGAAAHKLKSSAHSVGALALSELCAELEQAGNIDSNVVLAALLPGFERELLAVEECLDSLLQQRHRAEKK